MDQTTADFILAVRIARKIVYPYRSSWTDLDLLQYVMDRYGYIFISDFIRDYEWIIY